MTYRYPRAVFIDQWVLRPDGTLDAKFVDSPMRLSTSPISTIIEDLNIVITEAGLPYVLRQPKYDDLWPSNIPANMINDVLYAAIYAYGINPRGDALWMLFQDGLAELFADYAHLNGR